MTLLAYEPDPPAIEAFRLQLRAGGFSPLPLNGKRPLMEGWARLGDVTEHEIRRWTRIRPAETNTGVLTRTSPAFDIDILDPEAAEAVERLARERFEESGVFPVRFGKRLARKPLMASNANPAFLARAIEKHRPTVLIDEFDAMAAGDQAMAEALRGQLNSSFDRDGAKVGKCVPLPGGGYDEREFSTWAATWIAGIRKIPDTVEDRSVVLRLKRKLSSEKVARFRGRDGGELTVLKRKTIRFVADNEHRLRDIEPDMPEALNAAGDRATDAWEPLIAIADVAGGDWPQRARNAARLVDCRSICAGSKYAYRVGGAQTRLPAALS